jgi:hypothetical protein
MIGKGFWEVVKFILSMVVTVALVMGLFWGLLIWQGSYSCAYQAKKMHLIYDYNYFSGCYFVINGKWLPSNLVEVCSVACKEKP